MLNNTGKLIEGFISVNNVREDHKKVNEIKLALNPITNEEKNILILNLRFLSQSMIQ